MVRKEDEHLSKRVEEFKEQQKAMLVKNVEQIKEETKFELVDNAKRFFYEKRLLASKEVREMSAKCEKDRIAGKADFQTLQNAKRKKAKGIRDAAGESRTSLRTQRAQAAAGIRDARLKLAKERQARKMQDEYQKQTARQAVLQSLAFDPGDIKEGMPSPSRLPAPSKTF